MVLGLLGNLFGVGQIAGAVSSARTSAALADFTKSQDELEARSIDNSKLNMAALQPQAEAYSTNMAGLAEYNFDQSNKRNFALTLYNVANKWSGVLGQAAS